MESGDWARKRLRFRYRTDPRMSGEPNAAPTNTIPARTLYMS